MQNFISESTFILYYRANLKMFRQQNIMEDCEWGFPSPKSSR